MIGVLLGFMGSVPKSVSLSTNDLFGGAFGPATAMSLFVTVNQRGLVAPITYSWSKVSGSSAIYPQDASAQITRFNGYVNGAQISAVWKCTVTDSTGFSQDTPNLTITFEDLNAA